MKGAGGELLSPVKFIPVAERMGLIHHIDLWVVSRTIDYIAQLPKGSEEISFPLICRAMHYKVITYYPYLNRN